MKNNKSVIFHMDMSKFKKNCNSLVSELVHVFFKLNASMNTVNNNLEKFRSIQMEINAKSSLVEVCRESANLIALFTENANGTRLTISELRERFKKVVNGIQSSFLKLLDFFFEVYYNIF